MKIYLGPFQGITEAAYRSSLAKSFKGIDVAMTPFITNVHGRKIKNVHSYDIWPENNQDVPTVPQMLSKDAEEMISIAKVCHDFGYDEINWNLGCPFPKVANKQRGSGMLPHPDLIRSLLEEVMPDMPIKLSIKCRLGLNDPKEIEQLISIYNAFPLSELIIHPRIGKQLYKGFADPKAFKELIGAFNMPLVYNGDIFTKEDFHRLNELFEGKIDRWMLGRGILTNPFLSEEIMGLTCEEEERIQRLRAFLSMLLAEHCKRFEHENNAVNRMKELWSYMSKMFEDPQAAFRYIRKSKTADEYSEGEQQLFKNCNFAK